MHIKSDRCLHLGAVQVAQLLEGAGIREPGTSEGSKQSHSLTALGLEWNGIGTFESGIQALCKALSSNAVLQDLDLRNNSISPAGRIHTLKVATYL
jgi:hypothetical protein